MVGEYKIRQSGKTIGWVLVEKQGLYYHIRCRCELTGEVMHKLVVRCGTAEENLGVCVPVDGMFGVDKMIPCKRLGEGTPEFILLPKHENLTGKFVAVYPEEPFAYLSRLKGAYLAHQAQQLGIVLPE